MKKIDPIGVELPFLEGKNLLGEEIPLPYYKKGEIRIFSLILTPSSKKDARTWTQHILKTFEANPEIHYFEVRFFSSLLKPLADRLDEQAKAKGERALLPHLVRAYDGRGEFCRKVGISKKNLCHLYLLDRKGLVRYWGKGPANSKQQQELMAEIHRIYQRS